MKNQHFMTIMISNKVHDNPYLSIYFAQDYSIDWMERATDCQWAASPNLTDFFFLFINAVLTNSKSLAAISTSSERTFYQINPINLGMARCLLSADCTIKIQTVSQPVTYVNQRQCSRIKSVTLVSLCDVGPPFQSQDQRYHHFTLRMVIFIFVESCSVCICLSVLH